MFKKGDRVVCVRPRRKIASYHGAVGRVSDLTKSGSLNIDWEIKDKPTFSGMFADQFELAGPYEAKLAREESMSNAEYYAAVTE